MNCEHCGNPSATPTCDRCLGYQAWATSSHGDNQPTADPRHRARVLGRARADLVVLPDLMDELARCATEREQGTGGGGKVIGSPSPVRLDVVHLVDERRKPGWEGEDPRLRPLGDRYGAAALLESWTRVVFEEMPEDERPQLADRATVRTETAVLLEVWKWIGEQQWAEEAANDVLSLAAKVRSALRIPKPQRYRCPTCRARAFVEVGGFLVCEEGHEESIRDLEGRYRRRPALTTKEIVDEFPVTLDQLWQWKKRRKIQPARTEGRSHYWLPWDVFSLLNPAVAEAVDLRDTIASEANHTAVVPSAILTAERQGSAPKRREVS